MYTVMLVDDEEMILKGLMRLIPWEDFGLEVIATATDGQQAWSAFQAQRCDVLITDIRMPNMDGIALLEHVCARDARTKCLVISGYDDFRYVKQTLRLGIENYLLKPIDEEELSATLLSTVDKLDKESQTEHITRLGADTLRNHVLERWVSGSIAWDEMKSRADLMGFSLEADWYAVVALRTSSAVPDGAATPAIRAYSVPGVPGIQILLLMGSGDLAGANESILSFLNATIPPHMPRGIGQPVALPEDVPASRRDAYRALIWQALLPGSEAIGAHGASGDAVTMPLAQSQLEIAFRRGTDRSAIDQALAACRVELDAQPTEEGKLSMLYSLLELLNTGGADMPQHATAQSGASETVWHAFCAALRSQVDKRREQEASNPTVEAIYEYVDEHYHESISLQKLGDELHFNPAYLGQLFKQHSGQLFLDYLCAYRIEKAKDLLINSVYRSGDIAKMVGFHNPNYFANVFQKMTGVYPTVFRKMAAE